MALGNGSLVAGEITQNLQRIALYGWRALVGVCILYICLTFCPLSGLFRAYWEYGYKEAIAGGRRIGRRSRQGLSYFRVPFDFLFYLKYPPDKGEDGLSQEYTIEFPKFSRNNIITRENHPL